MTDPVSISGVVADGNDRGLYLRSTGGGVEIADSSFSGNGLQGIFSQTILGDVTLTNVTAQNNSGAGVILEIRGHNTNIDKMGKDQ